MKTTKPFFYGLLLVAGLTACSKDYNSSPGTNGNAFGGSNPVAPITGAGPNEIVFRENGTIVRLKEAKYTEGSTTRTISGSSTAGTQVTSYALTFKYYKGTGSYKGNGKPADSFFIAKQVGDVSNPSAPSFTSFYSGSLSKDIPGYSFASVSDTAGERMKGRITGRIVRRDPTDIDKDFGEFIDITSGYFDASKFMP